MKIGAFLEFAFENLINGYKPGLQSLSFPFKIENSFIITISIH